MLLPHEIEMASYREPKREPCRFCGSDLCDGVTCGGIVKEQILEDRRQRKQEELWQQQDALAIEKRERALISKLRAEELEKVTQELERCRAEYESNLALIEKARAAELSDALQRAGAAGAALEPE